MDWFVKAFIKSSLLWLAVGVVLGTYMAMVPSAIIYRPAHVHANLLGFVTMMIFGVGYHVLPRFTGRALHNSKLAGSHVVVANTGLAGMVAGFISRAHAVWGYSLLLGGGATITAIGSFMFIYNIWRTIDGPSIQTTQIKSQRRAQ
jgi:cbb3-type cytochrome oxidase subunit 1